MVEWITSSGLTDYEAACREMEARADAIFAGRADEAIWLVEHPPLYTAGTSARPGDTRSRNRRLRAAAGLPSRGQDPESYIIRALGSAKK